jgi:hypothetical protein
MLFRLSEESGRTARRSALEDLREAAVVVVPKFAPAHARLRRHTMRHGVFWRCGGDDAMNACILTP